MRVDEAENRVRIFFDNKPPVEMRTALKGAGFRWAPSVGAWQRHASNYAWDDAKRITKLTVPAPQATPSSPPTAPPPTPAILGWRYQRGPVPVDKMVRSPANSNILRGTVRNVAEEQRVKALTAKQAAQPKSKGAERLDTAEIAALIRADIKEAVKHGVLPKAAKYSVVTDKYSMGSSITVKASALPFPVINPDAFVVHPGSPYMVQDRDRFASRYTPRAQAVLDKLNEIVNAYHWDKSDPMTDYYHERFARHVSVEHAKGEYSDLEKRKLAEARSKEGR